MTSRKGLRPAAGLLALACALVLAQPGLQGCSAKRTSETTTETIEYPAGATLPDGQVAEQDTKIVVTRETTKVTEKESGCGGPVGCTAKLTWELIKLPFRIVGFVIDVII